MKILKSLVIVFAMVAMVAGATSSYFTDTKTVAGNTFTAGTVILNVSPGSAVWVMGNMAPGQSVTNSLAVKNDGTLQSSLMASMAFAEADATPNPVPDMTAKQVAKQIEVTTATWTDLSNPGGLDLIPSITDANGNTWKDLDDVRAALAAMPFLAVLNSGETGTLTMTLQFRADANNDFQGDGVDATITLNLQNI